MAYSGGLVGLPRPRTSSHVSIFSACQTLLAVLAFVVVVACELHEEHLNCTVVVRLLIAIAVLVYHVASVKQQRRS